MISRRKDIRTVWVHSIAVGRDEDIAAMMRQLDVTSYLKGWALTILTPLPCSSLINTFECSSRRPSRIAESAAGCRCGTS